MDAYATHYKNKYPGARVSESEHAIDVHDADGVHRVALRKNGSEQWVDHSARLGCTDCHDLSPIPRDARVYKLTKDGRRALDEKSKERLEKGKAFMEDGKVLSIEELEQKGWKFRDGDVVSEPTVVTPATAQA